MADDTFCTRLYGQMNNSYHLISWLTLTTNFNNKNSDLWLHKHSSAHSAVLLFVLLKRHLPRPLLLFRSSLLLFLLSLLRFTEEHKKCQITKTTASGLVDQNLLGKGLLHGSFGESVVSSKLNTHDCQCIYI